MLYIWWRTSGDPQQVSVILSSWQLSIHFCSSPRVCFLSLSHTNIRSFSLFCLPKWWIIYSNVSLLPQGCGSSCGKCDCSGVKGAKVRFSFAFISFVTVSQSSRIFSLICSHVSLWFESLFKFVAGQSSHDSASYVLTYGSAQGDRLEVGLGGKAVDGAQSRSGDQDGNKDQFELERVRTHSWAEGLIPIRLREALRHRCTSGGGTSHELGMSCQHCSMSANHWPETWNIALHSLIFIIPIVKKSL